MNRPQRQPLRPQLRVTILNGARVLWIGEMTVIFGVCPKTIASLEAEGMIPRRRKVPDRNSYFWLLDEVQDYYDRKWATAAAA
jgi:hypothetical protein